MSFVPVQLRFANLPVREPNLSDAFELPPAPATELCLQLASLPNRQINSNSLDIRQFANKLEVIPPYPDVAAAASDCKSNRGLTPVVRRAWKRGRSGRCKVSPARLG
jgi:hypothetical protein